MCYDIKLIEALLPKRTITHLSFLQISPDFDRLHNIISRTSCSLTYLQVHNPRYTIPRLIEMDATPYRSLEHLGVFEFDRVSVRDCQNRFDKA
jgi:hypothetical protein